MPNVMMVVIMLNGDIKAIVLSVIMLSVVMLNVNAPYLQP
jgi:hypothetical protein